MIPRVIDVFMFRLSVDVAVDRDRQHDVRDDQDLKAQQDRPADTLSGALVGGPTAATAKLERGRPEGHQRPHHQDRHPDDFEPMDDLFHRVVEAHPRSPDLTGSTVLRRAEVPLAGRPR